MPDTSPMCSLCGRYTDEKAVSCKKCNSTACKNCHSDNVCMNCDGPQGYQWDGRQYLRSSPYRELGCY